MFGAEVISFNTDIKSGLINKAVSYTHLRIREIMGLEIIKTDDLHQKNMIIFRIRANAFLYNMARIIVGIITEIGSGSRDISDIELGFLNKGVNYSGSMADAKGLFLSNVGYKVF